MAIHIVARFPIRDDIVGNRVEAGNMEISDKQAPVVIGQGTEQTVVFDNCQTVQCCDKEQGRQGYPSLLLS